MPAGADVAPSRSDKTCEICGEEIRKSGIACDGENCTVFLHTKCFESIAKLFFTERKNWKCKNCAVKCKSVPTSSPADIKVLQHEVECLNREKELLINLNSELKSVNELLKEKLKLSPPNSESSSSYAAKTRVLGQGQTSGSTVSYSSTTKNQNMNIKRSAGIIVKANDNSVSTSDVLNDIQKNINPKDLQLRLDGIKKIRNGIIIYCDDDKSLAKLKDHAAHKLGSKYNINNTRLYNPRLLIKDIKTSENSSDADIIENIRSVNNLQDLRDQEMKVVTKLRYPNHIDLVVEVSPELRRFFMAQGYIYAGFSRCNVSDHIRVIRCSKCSAIGHLEKNCKLSVVCPHCGGDHRYSQCSSQVLKCTNCEKNNEKFKTKIAHLNVRSLLSDFESFVDLVHENNLDIIAVSETWLSESIDSVTVDIPGFNFCRKDRQSRGGGVGIYVRSTIKYEILTCSSDARLEHIFIKFKIGRRSYCLAVMYRPPHGNVLDGIECLDDLLPGVVTEYDNIIILGDLNINFLIQDNKVSQCFKSYGLTQVIVEPTRITETSSTLLDPIFFSAGANCVEKGTINADMLSDHQMVYCSLFCGIQKQQKFVTFRDYKNFNIDNFNKDLHQVPWDRILYLRDVESKLRFLTENINMLFDLHCPIRTVRVTRPKAPWLTSNLKLIFKERNRALSKFKNNPSPDNWNNYKSLRNFALMSLRNEKSAFLKHLQHQKNSSLLYKSLKNMHIQANKSIDIPQDLSDPHMRYWKGLLTVASRYSESTRGKSKTTVTRKNE
nr:unnamed protein product [Callosobruchus chinensis]